MRYISRAKGKSWRKRSSLYFLGRIYWFSGKYKWSCWSPYFTPSVCLLCVYLRWCTSQRRCPMLSSSSFWSGVWPCPGPWKVSKPTSISTSSGSTILRWEIVCDVMHCPFVPYFFTSGFWMKQNYLKSMLTQWTATKYAENLEGWIFIFFCQCLFTVYYCMLHSSIAELMCAL